MLPGMPARRAKEALGKRMVARGDDGSLMEGQTVSTKRKNRTERQGPSIINGRGVVPNAKERLPPCCCGGIISVSPSLTVK